MRKRELYEIVVIGPIEGRTVYEVYEITGRRKQWEVVKRGPNTLEVKPTSRKRVYAWLHERRDILRRMGF